MITKIQSMTVEELQSLLDRIGLLDSWQAAQFLGLSPATLRNPKNRYLKLSIKIGQYRYWRKGDLEKMQRWYISRKIDGHAEYLVGVRWSRKRNEADTFDSYDDALGRRAELFGPHPGKTYGTYPTIHTMNVRVENG